jgi:CHAT domain-containing protein
MSFQLAKCLVVFSLLALLPQFIFAQTPTETPIILELNKPIERELTSGKIHEYQIVFTVNQYAKITIEQKGVDVGGKIIDSTGKVLTGANVERTSKGFETLEIVVNESGNHQLQVSTTDLRSNGKYKIELIDLRTATEKDKALDEARRLDYQANQFWLKDDCDAAQPLALTALEIFERELNANDLFVGRALFTVANQCNCKGDSAKAEPLFLRSLKIYESIFGKENNQITPILTQLGNLHENLGDYPKAEDFFKRVLEIREKTLEPNHLSTAFILNTLGGLSNKKGDISKAESYVKRSLAINEKAVGLEDPRVANNLINLANLSNDLKITEPLYLRALAIREKAFGKESQAVASILYNMATVYVGNGDYVKAEDYGERSLAIAEKSGGLENPFISFSLNLLGVVYANRGKYSEAEAIYLRAIAIKEKSQGAFHPEVGGAISNLADVYALKGDVEKAIATQKRANEIVELNISANLSSGSEREKLAYLETIQSMYSRSLTLNFQYAVDSKSATNLAAEIILRQKGRVLDVISNQMSILRDRFDEKDRKLLDDLADKNKQISEVILNNLSSKSREKIQSLINEREQLEVEISRRASAYIEKSKPFDLAEIQSQIPNNSALLEFAVYKPSNFKESENISVTKNIEPHYSVYILQNNGIVKSKDLGEIKPINEAIAKFREALQDPKNVNIKQLARELDKKIMSPIREFLGDSTQLLVSPDGDLNLIPFEALVDESGKYLVEKYSISYLSSGRDLLRMQNSKPNPNSPLIIANPDFGVSQTAVKSDNLTVSKRDKKRNVNVARSLAETYFSPLSGTEQEGKSIQTLFPESTLLTGSKATKEALKQAKSPSILHIATHGFYLEDKEKSSTENPLLRSGIALAGANARISNNGIVTALEASGLNLFGTKLVVLSACGTGLGEVQSGEGVFGLRRSFVLAGSESLVISLWSVSDYITRELMTHYYKNLKSGNGRGESLRKVQLEMIKNPKRQHPFYWASFIESGNWKSL